MENELKVGFGRRCITPLEPVPLQGYGNVMTRISNNVLSDIYTTCIAFTDGQGVTVLLFHNDLTNSGEEISNPIRSAVCEATGVPVSHIMIAATHTHSAPACTQPGVDCIIRYNVYLQEQMVLAAREALQDRKAAKMYIAWGETKNLNFVRHYMLEDGHYKGDNFGDSHTSPYKRHTTLADPEMRLVKFAREGGKDVLLVNWQCHPHRTGGSKKYDVSSDIIGVMRDVLEEKMDCCFAYFTGGAGNLNPTSRIKSENIYGDYMEAGKALAKYALEAAEGFALARSGEILVEENLHRERIHRPDSNLYAAAKQILALWEKTNDYKSLIPACDAAGINSPYTANAIVRKHNMKQEKIDVPMYAISIGDLALVTAPYEMFDTNAKYIRDNSPYKMTFVVSCANDADSYIPSAYGYIHGGYEADNCWFAPGTGEVFANIYVEMLRKLHMDEYRN